uniref:Exonuclease domain-containing protein n=1 Tax=Urocitellus parryii TaxID=9999 RepID=A0A8D2HXP8_UROPR
IKCSGISLKFPGKMVAIDCEMVGTGPKGPVSSLARCSIANYDGDVLYNEYILPPCHIVNYQTKWSGICKKHMVNATSFKTMGRRPHNPFPSLITMTPRNL